MVNTHPTASGTGFLAAWCGLIAVCLLYACVCDVSVRIIPNRISAAIAALAIPFRLLHHDLLEGLAVASLIFFILTSLWTLRLLGGGDVKFWASCSLLISPGFAAQGAFSLHVVLIGGVVALAYLALRIAVRFRRRRDPIRTPASGRSLWIGRVWRAEQWRAQRGGSIPYGVAIAAAAWFAFLPSVHS